jgi:hypothetical protein
MLSFVAPRRSCSLGKPPSTVTVRRGAKLLAHVLRHQARHYCQQRKILDVRITPSRGAGGRLN